MINYNWIQKFSLRYKYESEKYNIDFNLNPHELLAFKTLITFYLNSCKSWEHTYNNGREHYLRIIADDITKIHWFDGIISDCPQELLSAFVEIHVCYDAININKLFIISYLKNNSEDAYTKINVNSLNEFSRKIKDDVSFILSRVRESIYLDNFIYQNFELVTGNFTGYYDFGDIQIDFGAPIETHSVNRIIRCKIKYKKIICTQLPFETPFIETFNSDIKIAITLCQVFLRCGISSNIYNGKYYNFPNSILNDHTIDTDNLGVYVPFQRGHINSQYTEDVTCDTPDLFKKFKLLDYKKQNIFLVSCYSYAYANKLSNVQAVTHYVIALENLAEFEYKNNANSSNSRLGKKDKIYILIKSLFKECKITKDFVDYFYSIRCLYAHEGVANNRIYQDILGVHDGDKMLQIYMEELTYSVLVQWLLNT